MSSDDEFLQELLAAFQVEADEHVQVMSEGLLELERTSTPAEQLPLLERVYREAHSLKGAARAVNMTDVETVCQSLETVFSAWKRQETALDPAVFDTVHHAVTLIGDLLSSGQADDGADRRRILETTQQLSDALTPAAVQGSHSPSGNGRAAPPPTLPVEEAPEKKPPAANKPHDDGEATVGDRPVAVERRPGAETVRIATDKLETLLRQTEEMLMVKLTAAQRATDLREAEESLEQWGKEWSKVLPDLRLLRLEMEKEREAGQGHQALPSPRILDFLEWNHVYFKSLEGTVLSLSRDAERDRREIGGKVDGLLENTKKLLMLPFSTLLGAFPKMVRDLSRDQGKDVQLVIEGGEVEIDKRILESLKDPLVHLLRNSVDHGIESPGERARLGKPSLATVGISVSQSGGNEIQVLIADDGGGIDVEKVKASAVKHGAITPEEADGMRDAEALALIFQSDVSTSPIITEISGRGLGMAIVREKVEEAGGQITLETQKNQGTSFHITLPLTLATFKGIVVEAGGETFVIPTASVERVDRILDDAVRTVENIETVVLEGRVLPLVRLEDVLELARRDAAPGEAGYSPVIVLALAEKRIAFRVHAVLNEQEVLVKNLGKPLLRVRNVSGATVLGTGKAVPILHVADLMKSASKASLAPTRLTTGQEDEQTDRPLSILVAEDSITSRMLLKNILETAGYNVTTAVDGMEALTTFRTQDFDLVVSDVDMPRMSGFELTAKIREDATRGETPLILVTARDTREDRERGVDVGANAYLVKSSFDQSNLLAAIRRLI